MSSQDQPEVESKEVSELAPSSVDASTPETGSQSVSSPEGGAAASSAETQATEAESKTYPYHPDNANAKFDGYVHSLTPYQLGKLERMRALIQEHKEMDIDKYRKLPAESLDHYLLRFLRARKFKVKDAWDMLVKDYMWREETKVNELRNKTPEEILGLPNLDLLNKYLPGWIQGFDKQGRPVLFKRFGRCDVAAMLQHTTLDKLLMHHVWTQETLMHKLSEQSAATGYNIETICAVFDASGWRLGLATSTAYSFLKGMADLDSWHYPERLGAIYVVNSPTLLSVAWRVIRSWLDERTRTKIHILGGIDEFGPILREVMDENTVLPVEFGGQAVSLEPQPAQELRSSASPTSPTEELDEKDKEALEIANQLASESKEDTQSPEPAKAEPAQPKKRGWFW